MLGSCGDGVSKDAVWGGRCMSFGKFVSGGGSRGKEYCSNRRVQRSWQSGSHIEEMQSFIGLGDRSKSTYGCQYSIRARRFTQIWGTSLIWELQKVTPSPLSGASCVETVGIRPANLQTEGPSPFPDVSSDRHTS